jgi:CheY-like chemotaxis protein
MTVPVWVNAPSAVGSGRIIDVHLRNSPMLERVTSTWRRRSDASTHSTDRRVSGKRVRSVSSNVPRILIVDNDMRAADSLELLLNAAGYAETQVAYSAHVALVFAAEFHPDVAFLEMDLLDMDTDDLGERLRERAKNDLRLIAVTGNRERAGRDVARNNGFARYLFKPIGVADLSELLDPIDLSEREPA